MRRQDERRLAACGLRVDSWEFSWWVSVERRKRHENKDCWFGLSLDAGSTHGSTMEARLVRLQPPLASMSQVAPPLCLVRPWKSSQMPHTRE